MNEKFQVCDPLTEEELEALKADIEETGVRDPIEIDEEGNILDGHNRKRIADELGIPCPFEVVRGLETDERKRDYARKRNCLRRQMTVEAKKKMARQMIAENPERSARSVGRAVGLAQHTVEKVRREMGLPDEQSAHNESDDEPPAKPPAHAWMDAPDWQMWHKAEAFSYLGKMGEQEQRVMDEVLNERARPPRDAVAMLERCAAFVSGDRERMVELWESDDPRSRDLVRSKLSGCAPLPDARLPLLLEATQSLDRVVGMTPGHQLCDVESVISAVSIVKCALDQIRDSQERW